MARPQSLLRDVQGFARDYPRDSMPDGYLWDLADYVPTLLDAKLTGRGGWRYASDALTAPIVAGIYATFTKGDQLLTFTSDNKVWQINTTSGAASGGVACPAPAQNPVQLFDWVLVPDGAGAVAPKLITAPTSTTINVAASPASAPKFKYAAVYKTYVLGGNIPGGNENKLVASFPGTIDSDTIPPNSDKAWPTESFQLTSLPITAVGAIRAMILIFHAGSVERMRGSKFPLDSAAETGDFSLESLHERAGCGDARSLAYWNDNAIFADERGCHMTDGAIVRNLISQGGLLTFWRALYRAKQSIAAQTYLDYYIVTVVRTDGIAVTLICDLNRKSWFRFTNIKAISYLHSVGAQENLWAGRSGDNRLISMAECFFPPAVSLEADGDGTNVLPVFETPWYRISEEGRKRIRFAYLSYDTRNPPSDVALRWRAAPEMRFEDVAPFANGVDTTAFADLLELAYVVNPSDGLVPGYTVAGNLPGTDRYSRYRIPIGKQPYGIGFRVRQTGPSSVTRIYDLAVDAWPEERSRT